jgi:hypothetical protein
MSATLRNVLFLTGITAFVVWAGCGDETKDDGSTTTAQSTTTGIPSTNSSTTGGMTTTTSSTGAGATGPGCDDVPVVAPSNGNCIPLGTGPGGAGGAGGGVGGLGGIGGIGGMTVGVGGAGGAPSGVYTCNPVTSEPCDTAAGEACDFSDMGQFVCFAPPNTEAQCEPCNNNGGPFCLPGFTCYPPDGRQDIFCRRYCCDDGDCGPTLHCHNPVMQFADAGATEVGICGP